ncbi:MAG: zinc dependent phospholipase C family protein [Roseburia sp.]
MPSTYAHYRMGQEVRSSLDEDAGKIVEEYPDLFLIGNHGPDILFYYKPLFSNKINQIGYGMHERAGKEFFEHAATVIKRHQGNDAYLSYVYGFICHFALDVTCHGYIDEKIASSGISHAEIEVEFDRMLMVKDGYDPVRHRLTEHIIPSVDNAEIIREFFQETDSEQIRKALEGTIKYNNLLVAPSKGKRFLINSFLTVTGNYKELHGLMVNYQANPHCADSTEKLWALYQEAKKLAIVLIHEYQEYLAGPRELNSIYDYTFSSQLTQETENKNAV